MAEIAAHWVSIVPSAKDFGPNLGKQIDPEAESAGKRAGKKLGAGLKIGALLAFGAGVKIFKGALDEAREAQVVGAKSAAIIAATGGAAKITEKQLGDLTSSISKKAGVDDEAIQSGANLLLTFKNVRNEVGRGNQIFNQATQAAVDLSAAGFGSIEGASKMLGKALNDPVKGMSALGRAGVTFSAAQQKQIKGYVKSGNTLKAQKAILKEVQSQVGGTAAASATAGDKASVAWGNFKETLGTKLMPTVDKVLDKGTKLTTYLSENSGVLSTVGAIVGGVLVTGFALWTAAIIASNAALLANPVGLVVVAIAALIGGLVAAYIKFDGFRNIVNKTWAYFKVGAAIVFPFVLNIIKTTFNIIKSVVSTVMPIVLAIVRFAWKFIATYIRTYVNIIIGVVKTIIRIVGFIRNAFNTAKSIVVAVVGGIVLRVRSDIGRVVSFFKGLIGKIKGALSGAKNALTGIGKDIVNGLISGIKSMGGKIKDALIALLPGPLKKFAKKLGIHSPSRVFHQFGVFVGQGFANGMDAMQRTVGRSATGLAAAALIVPGVAGAAAPRVASSDLVGASGGGMDGYVAALTVTNWEDGTGYFELIAEDRIDNYDNVKGQISRM